MKPEFDKDIPVPPQRYGKYDLHLMEVGHSKLWPFEAGIEQRQLVDRISAAHRAYSAKHKTKFTIRKLHDGVRIWRLS